MRRKVEGQEGGEEVSEPESESDGGGGDGRARSVMIPTWILGLILENIQCVANISSGIKADLSDQLGSRASTNIDITMITITAVKDTIVADTKSSRTSMMLNRGETRKSLLQLDVDQSELIHCRR